MGSKIEPVLSIIMPAYNAEKYISEAIESIINQTYTNWELLICDDNSTDKTYEIAKSFMDERIKLFKNPVNKKNRKRLIGYLLNLKEKSSQYMMPMIFRIH